MFLAEALNRRTGAKGTRKALRNPEARGEGQRNGSLRDGEGAKKGTKTRIVASRGEGIESDFIKTKGGRGWARMGVVAERDCLNENQL